MDNILDTLRDMRREIIVLLSVAVLCWFTSAYLFQMSYIAGRSMDPTYHNGQFVFIQKQYAPVIGDAVAFRSDELDAVMIKRIIAGPGDTVDIRDGIVLVNGSPCEGPETLAGDLPLPVTLAGDEYFVLGDNRLLSHDSRYIDFGFMQTEELIGKVLPQRSPAL